MPYASLDFQEGIYKDETELASRPHWTDGDLIRFYRGRPQPIGGWELASVDTFNGLCRGLTSWAANDSRAFGAVGTSTRLYAFFGGRLFNITPIRSSATLGAAPFATTVGSSTVTVTHASHGASSNDTVYVYGPTVVNNVQVGGTGGTFASNPFTTSSGSKIVTVTRTAHGLASGDIENISGGTAVGGITLSGDYTVYRIDADNYQVEHSSAATSAATGGGTPAYKDYKALVLTVVTTSTYTVTGTGTANATSSGGGSAVEVKYEISVGQENGLGGGGFGSGGYGGGGYGVGTSALTNQPRVWSLCNWGEYLIANPRFGGVYEWQLNTSQRAAIITNAPTQVGSVFVTPERILVAVGAYDGTSYSPRLIKWTDSEDNTVWTASATNLAGDETIQVGSYAVAGKPSASQNVILTELGLIAMQFNGDPNLVFQFRQIEGNFGLIGTNAIAQAGGLVFWVTPNHQFVIFDGGSPQAIDCPVKDYFFDALSPAQEAKIYVGVNSAFSEFWVWYPRRETSELECNAYLIFNWKTGSWSIGELPRSAMIDRGVLGNPVLADTSGNLWYHETGTSANGASIAAFVESSPILIGEGDSDMDILQWCPDFQDLAVGVQMTLYTRDKPQGTETANGPYTAMPGTEDVDLRVAGRQARVRYDSVADPSTTWRGGVDQLEIQAAGNRT
jgi:hypothetical protein